MDGLFFCIDFCHFDKYESLIGIEDIPEVFKNSQISIE
ncbi:hypothetical protein SAMN05518672_11421 [Chitinophaga sp. CF118]|nr:hypothetical protein SAMN05518672_11421 [Chitinophaga sp. CF118]